MQDNIESLTDPRLSNEAAADKNFIAWFKGKMGNLHIPGNDLGILEQYLSLPYYLSKKYPVFQKLLNTQTNREELRSDGINQFLQAAQPFLTLKGPEVQNVEKALIEGDKEKAIYTEEQLRERFGLSSTGVEAYSSVRTTLDSMLDLSGSACRESPTLCREPSKRSSESGEGWARRWLLPTRRPAWMIT